MDLLTVTNSTTRKMRVHTRIQTGYLDYYYGVDVWGSHVYADYVIFDGVVVANNSRVLNSMDYNLLYTGTERKGKL